MNKKIIHLAAIIATVLMLAEPEKISAQHHFGARVGYGSGSSRFYPKREMGMLWGLYSGGVSWKYYSRERYVGGLEVDILFMQQGYKELMYQNTEGLRYERKVNSIMVPVFWQPHAYLFRRKMRVFLNLGVTFSVNMNSTYKIWSQADGTIEDGKYETVLARDNPLGYGLCGGGGISWIFDRWEVFGEARYYFGYGDLLRNRNKYQEDPDLPWYEKAPMRSPLDGLQISIGFYYRIGKGGILAPPSARVAAKLEDMEARLALERMQQGLEVLPDLENPGDQENPEETELTKKEQRQQRRLEKKASQEDPLADEKTDIEE